MRKNKRIQNIVYIALFAVFMAICAWISIPFVVPFTMQTFAVFLAFNLLGGKMGTAAVVIYLSIGAVGLPVYSGFSSGIGVLFGLNGGYMLGWILSGLIVWLFDALPIKRSVSRIISSVIGLAVSYVTGMAWFMTVYASSTGEIGLLAAFSMCILPFIIPDAVKLTLAVLLARRMEKAVLVTSQ